MLLKGACLFDYPVRKGKQCRVLAKLFAGNSYTECRRAATKWKFQHNAQLMLNDINLFEGKDLGYLGKGRYVLLCPMVMKNVKCA